MTLLNITRFQINSKLFMIIIPDCYDNFCVVIIFNAHVTWSFVVLIFSQLLDFIYLNQKFDKNDRRMKRKFKFSTERNKTDIWEAKEFHITHTKIYMPLSVKQARFKIQNKSATVKSESDNSCGINWQSTACPRRDDMFTLFFEYRKS